MYHGAVIRRVGQNSTRRSLCQARMPQVVISDRGTRVCLQVHERPLWLVTDQGKHIHRLSSPDRWSNRASKPKRLRNTSEYSSTIFKTTGLNGYLSWHSPTITTYTLPPVKAPSRLTTAIMLTSSLVPNPKHLSGCLRPLPLFQKCRKSMKKPNVL